MAIGPVIGSFIYGFCGFVDTFMIYGGILFISTIPLIIFIPRRVTSGNIEPTPEEKK